MDLDRVKDPFRFYGKQLSEQSENQNSMMANLMDLVPATLNNLSGLINRVRPLVNIARSMMNRPSLTIESRERPTTSLNRKRISRLRTDKQKYYRLVDAVTDHYLKYEHNRLKLSDYKEKYRGRTLDENTKRYILKIKAGKMESGQKIDELMRLIAEHANRLDAAKCDELNECMLRATYNDATNSWDITSSLYTKYNFHYVEIRSRTSVKNNNNNNNVKKK